MRARQSWKRIVLGVLLFVTSLSICTTAAWASTRIGNAELQMWYRMRNTFHTDGGNHVDWVQWRNVLAYPNIELSFGVA